MSVSSVDMTAVAVDSACSTRCILIGLIGLIYASQSFLLCLCVCVFAGTLQFSITLTRSTGTGSSSW